MVHLQYSYRYGIPTYIYIYRPITVPLEKIRVPPPNHPLETQHQAPLGPLPKLWRPDEVLFFLFKGGVGFELFHATQYWFVHLQSFYNMI